MSSEPAGISSSLHVQGRPHRRRRGSACLAAPVITLLAAIALAYGGIFGVPLLFDDELTIVENPSIRSLWNLGDALSPPASAGTGGRPLANLSFAVSYAISGLDPWAHHAFNLLFHALASLTLYGVVRRTLETPRLRARFGAESAALAGAIAIFWAIHPLQTQTVTYVSPRTECLMALCYLLVFYCFIRGLEGRARVWHPLAVAACLAGVLCKEVAATVPLMLLVYDRTFISGTFQAAWRAHGRLYIALAASWLVLVPLLLDVGQRGVGFHLGALTVAAIAVTVQRNHDYRDAVGLWADTVAKSPGNHRAHGFLANLLARLPGRHEEAIAHYKHALELRPDFAAAHHNLAIILARLPHRAEEARIHQEAARRLLSNPGAARPETTGKRDDLPPARNQN